MVETIIRTYSALDASAKNVGFVDPEPAWDLPTSGLVAAHRLGRSLAKSLENRVTGVGSWGDMFVVGAEPTFDATSMQSNTAGYLAFNAHPPNYPMSFITVYEHQAATLLLGGNRSTATPGMYMTANSSNEVITRVKGVNTTDLAVATLTGMTARKEMVVGVADTVNDKVITYRPRTNTKVETAFALWGGTGSATCRIGNDTPVLRSYAHIVYTRAITDAEVAQIYDTVKASLAVSGIAI